MPWLLHRVGVFVLLVAGLVLARRSLEASVACVVACAIAYAVIGRTIAARMRRDGWADALRYDRWAAVIVPDWLGMLAAGLLLALPLWANDADALHPSAWLLWPMALLLLALPVIAARRDAFALRVAPDALELRALARRRRLPFDAIARITPWRRDLPGWLRRLAPLGLALGQPGATGAVMLARPSTGLALHLTDGRRVVIPCDGFAAGRRAILRAARDHGVPAPSG